MIVELKKRLLRNSASGILERLVNVFVFLWLQQYLVKRISPEEYSLYPVLMALLLFVPPLTTVTVSGLLRYVVEANARGDDRWVTQMVSTMFPIFLGVSTALLAIGGLFTLHIGSVLNIAPQQIFEAQIMMILLTFSVSLGLALAPFSIGLYVKERFVLLNFFQLCHTLIRLVLLFSLLIGAGAKVLWVVVATVTADVAILLLTTGLSRRVLPTLKFRLKEIRWELVKVLGGFGFWSMVGHVAHMIRTASDPLILNKLGTPVNVTCFYLGALPDTHIEATLRKATAPLQPTMVVLQSQGKSPTLQDFYLRAGRYCLWAALFLAVPLVIFRHELWSLYLGSSYGLYADAATVMGLLLARYWIVYPNEIMISMVAQATNQVRPLAIRAVLGACLNVAVTLYLVGALKMGAVGSALATVLIAIIWEPIIMWRFTLRLLDLSFAKWFRETICPGILPATIAGFLIVALKTFSPADSLLKLGILVVCGCIVYLSVLIAFCLRPDERRELSYMRDKFLSLRLIRSYRIVSK